MGVAEGLSRERESQRKCNLPSVKYSSPPHPAIIGFVLARFRAVLVRSAMIVGESLFVLLWDYFIPEFRPYNHVCLPWTRFSLSLTLCTACVACMFRHALCMLRRPFHSFLSWVRKDAHLSEWEALTAEVVLLNTNSISTCSPRCLPFCCLGSVGQTAL